MSNDSRQYCTFTVEDHLFALEVAKVQELIPSQVIKPIPRAPGIVRGLLNLRGQIVTAFDLREALGFPPRENLNESVNVIAYSDDEKISLLVDEIGEVVEISAEDCEPPPETIATSFIRMLDSVYKTEDRLLLILNIDKVVATDVATRLSPVSPAGICQMPVN